LFFNQLHDEGIEITLLGDLWSHPAVFSRLLANRRKRLHHKFVHHIGGELPSLIRIDPQLNGHCADLSGDCVGHQTADALSAKLVQDEQVRDLVPSFLCHLCHKRPPFWQFFHEAFME